MSNKNLDSSIRKAASNAYDDVSSKQTGNYQNHRHNQYSNAFGRHLDQELKPQGINFQREPNVSYGGRNTQPDFLIGGNTPVEVKAKSSGFNAHDRNVQIPGHKSASGADSAYGINFGKQGGPNVRKF